MFLDGSSIVSPTFYIFMKNPIFLPFWPYGAHKMSQNGTQTPQNPRQGPCGSPKPPSMPHCAFKTPFGHTFGHFLRQFSEISTSFSDVLSSTNRDSTEGMIGETTDQSCHGVLRRHASKLSSEYRWQYPFAAAVGAKPCRIRRGMAIQPSPQRPRPTVLPYHCHTIAIPLQW